jgi:hypothetical protein
MIASVLTGLSGNNHDESSAFPETMLRGRKFAIGLVQVLKCWREAACCSDHDRIHPSANYAFERTYLTHPLFGTDVMARGIVTPPFHSLFLVTELCDKLARALARRFLAGIARQFLPFAITVAIIHLTLQQYVCWQHIKLAVLQSAQRL